MVEYVLKRIKNRFAFVLQVLLVSSVKLLLKLNLTYVTQLHPAKMGNASILTKISKSFN